MGGEGRGQVKTEKRGQGREGERGSQWRGCEWRDDGGGNRRRGWKRRGEG